MKRNDNIKINGKACIKANPGHGGMHDQKLPSRAPIRLADVLLATESAWVTFYWASPGSGCFKKMLALRGTEGSKSTSLHRRACLGYERISGNQ